MRDDSVIRGFREHDRVINILHRRLGVIEHSTDSNSQQTLSTIMMVDVLISLLIEKGMITKDQFDTALKELSERTRKAYEEEQKKKADDAKAKVTVLSDKPEIEVVS